MSSPRIFAVALVLAVLALAAFRFPELGLVILFQMGRWQRGPLSALHGALLGFIDEPLVVFAFLMIVLIVRGRDLRCARPPEGFLLILHGQVLAFLVTFWFGHFSDYGLEKLVRFSVYTTALALLPFCILHEERAMSRAIVWIWGVGMAMAIMGVSSSVHVLGQERITALGAGPITFARIIGAATLAALALAAKSRTISLRLAYMGTAAFGLIAQVACGSRGPLVAMVMAVLLFEFLLWRRRPGRLIRSVVGSLLLAAFILGLLFLSVLFLNPHGRWTSIESLEASFRLVLFRRAWHLFLSKPLLGHGLGSYPDLAGLINVEGNLLRYPYPHNIFLEILSEGGLLAFSTVLLFILWVCVRGIKWYLRGDGYSSVHSAFLCALFAHYLLSAQMSGDLYDSRGIWFVGGVIVAQSLRVLRLGTNMVQNRAEYNPGCVLGTSKAA